jgi:hypothetical protein
MARIRSLELFNGELNGVYQKLWVAISENNNLFKTSDLEYFDNGTPDFQSTKWKHITNENYSQISDDMLLVRKTDYKINRTKKSNQLKL